MNCITRLKIGDINKNVICVLCGGYYIDATTIIECLHSFCRTCIVTYLKTSKTCPVCDTIVHKTRPHQNIRSDKLLQDLVYKLVPGLYKDEMQRRRDFYTKNYDAAPKRPGEERGDEMADRFAYTEEEKISLALYFCPEGSTEQVDFRRVFTTKEDMKARMEKRIQDAVDVRYLQCKAAVTIGHLKKFVRLKYGLKSHFQVDMFYNDELLRNSCTLCDVAYFFNWRRRAPLMLTFTVFKSTRNQLWAKEFPLLTHISSLQEKSAPAMSQATPSAQVHTETSSEPVTPTSSSLLLPLPPGVSEKSESLVVTNPKPLKPQQSSSRANSKNKASKAQSVSVKPRPSKQLQKTKSGSLGKRPATAPVAIAPAPAKMPGLCSSSHVDVTEFIQLDPKLKSKSKDQKLPASSTKFVSSLTMGMLPSVSKASCKTEAMSLSSATLSASSSTPNIVAGNISIPSTSLSSKLVDVEHKTSATAPSEFTPKAPPLPQRHSSASSLPFCSLYHSVATNSKLATPVRTSHLVQNQESKPASSSSSSASSSTPLSTVNITQSSPTNSVASPTPASSASPTPAAVPVQQSQTQGSDTLHLQPASVSGQTELTKKVMRDTSIKTTVHQTSQSQLSDFRPDICGLLKTEASSIPTLNSPQNIAKFANPGQRAISCSSKTIITDSLVSSAKKTEVASPLPTHSTTQSSAHPLPDKRETTNSPAVSPTSNKPSLSCSVPKVGKQKKIADIANTLHKRVSDALLNMVNKRSSSPSNRRPTIPSSAGVKSSNSPNTSSDLRGISSSDLSAKQNLQKMPPNGHFLGHGSSEDTAQHNQTNEPLNLVKGDKEFGRFTNGMFAVDIPPSLT